MTDKKIVDAIEKALKDCKPIEPDSNYSCSAEAVAVADGFWRGFLTALIEQRQVNVKIEMCSSSAPWQQRK